ncbi:MAG: NYN domain-containing protein [Clostridium sp.]|uniref:NYN domain-containing protein n=1 Tax=Clostridium sp. TaxID=1506 RepID=UPI002FCAE77B
MAKLDYILVDGYNVLNAWEETQKLKDNLEFARDKLVDMLCDLASYSGIKLIVVFDAHKQNGGIEKVDNYKGVEVVYTKEGEIADCYIERTVYLLAKKNNVGVVTSDNLEQSVSLSLGAIRITPKELLEQIRLTSKKIATKTQLSYVENKNSLENCVDKDILEKLEKMRRNL